MLEVQPPENKNPSAVQRGIFKRLILSGEGGIRTPGTLRYVGFQDRCIRPLCHFSAANVHVLSINERIVLPNFSRGRIPKGGLFVSSCSLAFSQQIPI